MVKKLPLVGSRLIGEAAPSAQECAMMQGMMDQLLAIYNATPDEYKLTAVVSLMTTICMNAAAPLELCEGIFAMVEDSIKHFEARPAGHG